MSVKMGPPKQKWSAEEEAALKAGVLKHGTGKWSAIAKDPAFGRILYLRSNVDIKDKWRNMNVMPCGFETRKKSGVKHKRVSMQSTTVKQEENVSSASDVPQNEEMPDIKPHARISTPPERSIERLDKLILEAVANLKNPGGSDETAIAAYIEDQCWTPPDFKHILSANLKYLISSGKLVKIDEELAKMRSVTPQEAAAAASRAVAEAEAAIAEAEEASREADEAEAYAKAAQAFVDAATKMLRGRSIPKMIQVNHHHHHHHHTQCILTTENYGQGLGREERRQLIPIKESATKESLDSRKIQMMQT